MSAAPMNVNLIPASLLAGRERRRWRFRWICVIVASTALAACVTAALRLGTGDRVEAMRAERSRLESQLRELNGSLPSLRAQVGLATRTAGAATVLSDRPDWSLLLAMLDRERGEGVVLERVQVRGMDAGGKPAAPGAAQGVGVQVVGLARRQSDVQSFVLALERSGVFDAVSPVGTSPRVIGAVEGVTFEVRCVIGRVPGVTP